MCIYIVCVYISYICDRNIRCDNYVCVGVLVCVCACVCVTVRVCVRLCVQEAMLGRQRL